MTLYNQMFFPEEFRAAARRLRSLEKSAKMTRPDDGEAFGEIREKFLEIVTPFGFHYTDIESPQGRLRRLYVQIEGGGEIDPRALRIIGDALCEIARALEYVYAGVGSRVDRLLDTLEI
ncbi:hypothetical protein [Mycobacteroides abscessus]|uniref:hypothetical protein n=1 Tax=Mycobacteroides abscessus TaxID=36809 RepID=UPI00078EAFA6|nr:hypothetical protein [Mycobacteroides abscessus]AMU74038.1 hypothetical protein A3O06_04710 [Mycobacteroides abscessus]ANO22974.1 hypothetical protein BAB79_04710 [Mycobacteroides abscessus]